MQTVKDRFWVRLLPQGDRNPDEREWREHGGKWILFDSREKVQNLAQNLTARIDSGQIHSAKYWNKDPSALCVYCLDRDKEKLLEILKTLDAPNSRVWEYDFAWDKNIQRPMDFLYSQSSKLRTILRSYGCPGTFQLMQELLAPARTGSELKRGDPSP